MTCFLQAVWFSFGKINSFSFSVSRSLIPHCSFISGFVQSAVSAFGSKLLKMGFQVLFFSKGFGIKFRGKREQMCLFLNELYSKKRNEIID